MTSATNEPTKDTGSTAGELLPVVTFRRWSDGPNQNERTGTFTMDGRKVDGLGKIVHEFRAQKGFTLQELGERAGTSKSHVWEIENNHTPMPRFITVMALLRALDLSPEDVFMTIMGED